MVDVFYAHRGGLLTLSAVTVCYMASDRFKNDEVNEHAVAYMSEYWIEAPQSNTQRQKG